MIRTLVPPALAALASACIFHAEVQVEHDDVDIDAKPTAVSVDLGAGDLNVFLADGDQVEVRRTLRYTGDRPDISARVEKGTLILEVECRNLQIECRVDHDVFLPAGADLSGGTGSGDIVVDAVPGNMTLTTGTGDVQVTTATGALVLETGSGHILVDDLIGTLDLDTGSGDIDVRDADSSSAIASTGGGGVSMDLLGAPSRVTIDTGSGDVSLTVPAGVYRVDTSTGSGDVRVEGVDRSSGADQVLDVETGSGNITITGR